MSAVQIYNLPQVVMLTYGVGASTLNFPLNRTDFKLYRGLTNTIQILIRDVDRAPVSFPVGQTPIVTIIHRETQKVLFVGPLTLIDAGQSLWTFTVRQTDIADWSPFWCNYTITLSDGQGGYSALYMNQGYTLEGSVEIVDGPFPVRPSAKTFLLSDFTQQTSVQGGSVLYYSPPLPGAAQLDNLSGLHTFAVYGMGLTGTCTVQALIDPNPLSTDSQWMNAASLDLEDVIGLSSMNFEGNYFWVRFVMNIQQGEFDKIMARC